MGEYTLILCCDCELGYRPRDAYPADGTGQRFRCRCCHEKQVMRETRLVSGLNQGGGYEMDRKPPTKKRGTK